MNYNIVADKHVLCHSTNRNQRNLASLVVGALLTISFPAVYASEGGSSNYLQGTYGDFATGVLGPSGVYVRNDALYYDADVTFDALGRTTDGHISQAVWGDLIKLAYISDKRFLGGRYNAALLIPFIAASKVSIHVAGRAPRTDADGNVSGLGDIYVTPAALGWQWGHHHLNATLSFIAPTGAYDDAKILTEGRNYWSFDPTLNYTWLHESRGHEITWTLGYLHNGTNSDAHYRTGDEIHFDWTLAQYLSKHFALGVTGYWYRQVTHDSGDLPTTFPAEHYDARGAGIGPAFLYTHAFGKKEFVFIGKWIRDTHATQRLDGDAAMMSVAFKL